MKKYFYILIALVVAGSFYFYAKDTETEEVNYPDLDPEQLFNVAHRGASGEAPELTMAAFEQAVEQGADYIEIDLQMTQDGVIVLMHDETVDRTTDGTGFVHDLTLREIKKLDAGSWFNRNNPEKARAEYVGLEVPTLEEAIEEYSDEIRFYIEIKEPNEFPTLEEELVRLLEEHELIGEDVPPGNVLVQSFGDESLFEIHALNPDIPLIQLVPYSEIPLLTHFRLNSISEYAVGIGLSYTQLDEGLASRVRKHDLLLHPYTINQPQHMEKMIEWGATGIITNYPGVLQEVIESNKEELIGYN